MRPIFRIAGNYRSHDLKGNETLCATQWYIADNYKCDKICYMYVKFEIKQGLGVEFFKRGVSYL